MKQVSKLERSQYRLRVKKIMDALRGELPFGFNYQLQGSILSGPMSQDNKGRFDIDVDITGKFMDFYKSADECYKDILLILKRKLKAIETTKRKDRVIMIERPQFTIDFAIVDKFTKDKSYILIRNTKGGFDWRKK